LAQDVSLWSRVVITQHHSFTRKSINQLHT
jgi:hypothetical protein